MELGKETYDDRKKRYITRIKSIINYASEENVCRSIMLLHYFGERDGNPCGVCDVCLKKKRKKLSAEEFEKIKAEIIKILQIKECTVSELIDALQFKEKKVLEAIRFLLDNRKLKQSKKMKLQLNKKI